jgi:hypothetical protein
MSARFDMLEARLLRGGVAPRHVRRYLRELNDHLSDITDARKASGQHTPTPADQSRAALGSDDELAHAMLRRREFRSLSARVPGLVFGALPVLVLLLVVPWHIPVLAVLTELVEPALFATHAELVLFTGNFLLVPAIAFLFVLTACRQRTSLIWPILSTLIVLVLSPHWETQGVADASPPGFSAFHLLYVFSGETFRSGFTPLFLNAWWSLIAMQWATLASQYLLILSPLVWLVHRHRKVERLLET